MCDPVSIGSIALSTAGGLVQAREQAAHARAVERANREAMERSRRARLEEQARQDALTSEANARFEQTLADMAADRASEANAHAAQDFIARLAAAGGGGADSELPAGFLLPGQDRASADVRDSIARQAGRAADEARRRIGALAALTGRGTVATDRNFAVGNLAAHSALLDNLRRGSLGVSEFEQTIPPAQIMPGDPMLGAILSGAGMVLGTGAVRNPFARPAPTPLRPMPRPVGHRVY